MKILKKNYYEMNKAIYFFRNCIKVLSFCRYLAGHCLRELRTHRQSL